MPNPLITDKAEAKKWNDQERKENFLALKSLRVTHIYDVRLPDGKAWLGTCVGVGVDPWESKIRTMNYANYLSRLEDFKDIRVSVTLDKLNKDGDLHRSFIAAWINGVRVK